MSDFTETKIFGDANDRTVNQALSAVSNWRKIAEYNTAGAYEFTVPPGCYKLGVFLLGGGGSGAILCYTSDTRGGGVSAGASGQLDQFVMDVVPGQVIPVVVGAGGASETVSGNRNGNAGGSSSFGGRTVVGGEGGTYTYSTAITRAKGAIGGQCSESSSYASGDPPYGCVHVYTKGETSSSDNAHAMTIPNLSRVAINRFDPTDEHVYCGAGTSADKAVMRARGRAGVNASASTELTIEALSATAPGDGGGSARNNRSSGSLALQATSGAGSSGLVMLYWGGM